MASTRHCLGSFMPVLLFLIPKMNSRVKNTKLFNLKTWIRPKIDDGTNFERNNWKFLYSTLFLTVSNCIQLWPTVLYRSLYFQILGWFLANCTVRYCTVTVLCVTLVSSGFVQTIAPFYRQIFRQFVFENLRIVEFVDFMNEFFLETFFGDFFRFGS